MTKEDYMKLSKERLAELLAERDTTLGILGKCYMGQLPTEVEDELKLFKSLKNKL